jgi:hypothetical protein
MGEITDQEEYDTFLADNHIIERKVYHDTEV